MPHNGPIDLDALVDLDALAVDGTWHWTFFAFPLSTVNEYGLPSDLEAQQYIAAVQATGVPIGIWLNGPSEGTGYAAVTRENVSRLIDAISGLQFSVTDAIRICERLFRDANSNNSQRDFLA